MVEKVFLGILAIVVIVLVMSGVFHLLNAPNTIANVSGLLLMLGLAYGSTKLVQRVIKKEEKKK